MNKFSLDVARPLPKDECESAKILINEGLIEEAKKLLFRVLANHPNFIAAQDLLKQIGDIELKEIFSSSSTDGKKKKQNTSLDDIEQLIQSLDQDLGLSLKSESDDPAREKFGPVSGLNAKELLDLAIGYVEMECYADALRELKKAERKIRMEESFLGETGLTIVSLIAQCLSQLGRSYEAKAFLEPILVEPDLKHEDKILLYYEMGCVEQELGNRKTAADWFEKVMGIDNQYKDVSYRLKKTQKKE